MRPRNPLAGGHPAQPDSLMKLLVTNPNISQSVSSLIQGEAERSAFAGTQITMLTAPFGIAYIETRFEALVGAYASAQLAAVHHTGHEAVIVAAFGDPGLAGLRDVLPVPVLGQTESTLASASLLGHRFSLSSRFRSASRPGIARSWKPTA